MNPLTRAYSKLHQKLGTVSVLSNAILRHALLIIGIVLLIALIILVGIWLYDVLPPIAWRVIGFSLLVVLVLWLIFRGIPRYQEYRFLKNKHGDLAPGNPQDDEEPREAMLHRILEAKKTIAHSPALGSDKDPLYRLPWFLLLGNDASQQDSLLRAATMHSPFPPADKSSASGKREFWHWWFYKSMIAIETDPAFVCDNRDRVMRGIWYQALQLLKSHRPKLPLNGLLILVTADQLRRSAEEIREYTLRLRRLIDETMQHLGIELPIYVTVTGCDAMPGFTSFLNALPVDAANQVVGHRLPMHTPSSGNDWEQLNQIIDDIRQRFHTIRLSALRVEADPLKRKGLFDFVEAFAGLKQGLLILVKGLVEDNPFQRNPKWRGLYFTAAKERAAFIEDLFKRFLPEDQPLAKRSQQATFGRWIRSIFGAACVAGLAWFATHYLSTVQREDAALLKLAHNACNASSDHSTIANLTRCREQIRSLEEIRKQKSFSFGIGKSGAEEQRLKQQFISDLRNTIIDPYDALFKRDLEQNKINFGHYLAKVQRLSLLQICLSDAKACSTKQQNVLFTQENLPAAPNADTSSVSPNALNDVYASYLAYLQWEDHTQLKQEQQKQREYLGQMIRGHPLTLTQINDWIAARNQPFALATFWTPQNPSQASIHQPPTNPTVRATFNRNTWEKILAPFLNDLPKVSPDKAQAKRIADQLLADYLNRYLIEWRDFLSNFFDGHVLWQDRWDDLIKILNSDNAPYAQLWKAVTYHVLNFSLLNNQNVSWKQALSHSIKNDTKNIAPALSAYAVSLQKDHNGQENYALASEIFSPRGGAGSQSALDFWKLWHLVEKPRDEDAKNMLPEDRAAWSAFQGPVRLTLVLIAHKASQYVQYQWQKTVVEPMKNMPQKERLNFLAGENGKLNFFTDVWLGPFLSERDKMPLKVLGVSFPISSNFQQLLYQSDSLKKAAQPLAPFNAGMVQVTKPSSFGSMKEGAQGTIFELDCQGRKFTASSVGGSLAEMRTAIFWSPESCADVRIKIAFPDTPMATSLGTGATVNQPSGLSFVKTYGGANGFVDFLKDFKRGAKSFSIGEFKSSYAAPQWQAITKRAAELGINHAQVFINVGLSDEMEKYLKGPPAISLPQKLVESPAER